MKVLRIVILRATIYELREVDFNVSLEELQESINVDLHKTWSQALELYPHKNQFVSEIKTQLMDEITEEIKADDV